MQLLLRKFWLTNILPGSAVITGTGKIPGMVLLAVKSDARDFEAIALGLREEVARLGREAKNDNA
jgi:hypothetical protein